MIKAILMALIGAFLILFGIMAWLIVDEMHRELDYKDEE